MRIFIILSILINVILSCSKREGNAIRHTDSLDSEGAYSALTLDELREFYNSDSTLIKAGTPIDLTIDFDCAVFISPPTEEIDKTKNANGTDNIYAIETENSRHQRKAIEMLVSAGIKIATNHGDSLRFRGENKTWGFDLEKNDLTDRNIILFSRTKGPQIISIVNLTTRDINDYFDIRK